MGSLVSKSHYQSERNTPKDAGFKSRSKYRELVDDLASERLMSKRRCDDSDYSVVIKNRGSPPNLWKWEIYRAGRSNPIGQSPNFFHTVAAASKAGKAALKQLLNKLNT